MKPAGPKLLSYNGGCPRHWGCRSTEVPITITWRELGIDMDELPPMTRHSMDGEVPGDMTASEWLRQKDLENPHFADRVFGQRKADLWREGRINERQLIDQKGRPLSLKALRAKGLDPDFPDARAIRKMAGPTKAKTPLSSSQKLSAAMMKKLEAQKKKDQLQAALETAQHGKKTAIKKKITAQNKKITSANKQIAAAKKQMAAEKKNKPQKTQQMKSRKQIGLEKQKEAAKQKKIKAAIELEKLKAPKTENVNVFLMDDAGKFKKWREDTFSESLMEVTTAEQEVLRAYRTKSEMKLDLDHYQRGKLMSPEERKWRDIDLDYNEQRARKHFKDKQFKKKLMGMELEDFEGAIDANMIGLPEDVVLYSEDGWNFFDDLISGESEAGIMTGDWAIRAGTDKGPDLYDYFGKEFHKGSNLTTNGLPNKFGNAPVRMKIHVKAQTQALSVDSSLGTLGTSTDQGEILLGRSTRYKIRKMEEKDGFLYIEMDAWGDDAIKEIVEESIEAYQTIPATKVPAFHDADFAFDDVTDQMVDVEDEGMSLFGGGGDTGYESEYVPVLSKENIRQFDSGQEFAEWRDRNFAETYENLTQDQKWAVQSYKGNNYETMNRRMRGMDMSYAGRTPDAAQLEGLDNIIADMNSALKPLPEDIRVYRGTSTSFMERLGFDSDYQEELLEMYAKGSETGNKDLMQMALGEMEHLIGGEVTDKAFLSTRGHLWDRPGDRGLEWDELPVQMSIDVKKGTRGIFPELLENRVGEEYELILEGGLRTRIANASIRKNTDGFWIYFFELEQY